jgi:hypothetical protein
MDAGKTPEDDEREVARIIEDFNRLHGFTDEKFNESDESDPGVPTRGDG